MNRLRIALWGVALPAALAVATACSCNRDEPEATTATTGDAPTLFIDSVSLGLDPDSARYRWPLVTDTLNTPMMERVRELLSFMEVTGHSRSELDSQWASCECGLYRTDFVVNYNAHGLLDIAFQFEYVYAEQEFESEFITIDLNKGRRLKIGDLMLKEKLPDLLALCDKKLVMNAQEARTAFMDSPDAEAEMLDFFTGYTFRESDLSVFTISAQGIHFMYDFAFPGFLEAYEPNGFILVPFSELSACIDPDGPLGFMAKKPA
jgi:hypothetical protein